MHLNSVSPDTEIVACWPENSPALFECLRAGRIIEVPEKPTLSVSTAGGIEPGAVTLELAQQVIDRSVLVTEAEILDAARRIYREDGEVIEGAAAVAVAAFLKTAAGLRGQDRGDRDLRRQCRSGPGSPDQGMIRTCGEAPPRPPRIADAFRKRRPGSFH